MNGNEGAEDGRHLPPKEEKGPDSMVHVLSLKFRRADAAFKRAIERRVKDTGVFRSQHRLLMHLNMQPNCSQVMLAEHLEISPAAIAVSIKKLEKGGYIRREIDSSDSRVHQVTITPKGEMVIQNSIKMFQEVEARMFQDFSEEEKKQMDDFLERIYHNLGSPRRGEKQ